VGVLNLTSLALTTQELVEEKGPCNHEANHSCLPFYLVALFFITRSSAIPRKTVMWMLVTLFVIIAMFIGLAGLASSAEVAYGLGGLGSLIGMVVSVAVGLKHMRSHKRPAPKPAGNRQSGVLD
jgi:hypothetical protein